MTQSHDSRPAPNPLLSLAHAIPPIRFELRHRYRTPRSVRPCTRRSRRAPLRRVLGGVATDPSRRRAARPRRERGRSAFRAGLVRVAGSFASAARIPGSARRRGEGDRRERPRHGRQAHRGRGGGRGRGAHLAYLVARLRATRFVYAGDFEHAAAALVAVIPALAKHPELADEFWSHNAMMMIREAQGDPAAALAENDQATLCAARGTWDPQGRDDARLPEGPLAPRLPHADARRVAHRLGRSRRSSQYAQAALDEYRHAEASPTRSPCSRRTSPRSTASATRRSLPPSASIPAKDDDVEDLYLVVVGLEAGGDHAAAEAVRRVMRRPGARAHRARDHAPLARPRREARRAPHGFTPWHATTR